MNSIRILQGDCRQRLKDLPSESVHCVVTSPPYWSLRDYGVAGQIGLEDDFEAWVDEMVAVFEEVRRVLRKDGTLWLNLGDSYYSPAAVVNRTAETVSDAVRGHNDLYLRYIERSQGLNHKGRKCPGLKAKDLIGQPWRVAFALRAAGWWLRSEIIWHKTNAMPESITDRPVKSHEQVFMLTKAARYFYDAESIAEPASASSIGRGTARFGSPKTDNLEIKPGDPRYRGGHEQLRRSHEYSDRVKKRTVWSIASEPFSEAHFATFPTALVEPCIKAGTSEKGCCPKCLAPWVRTFEDGGKIHSPGGGKKRADTPGSVLSDSSVMRTREVAVKIPTGWRPGCKCDAGEPIPCTVLDPFNGAGTTGLVAARNMRSYVGVELNPEYVEMAAKRLSADMPLLNRVEVVA